MKYFSSPVLFADDTSFVIANSNIEKLYNALDMTLDKAHNWFKSNSMLLNNNKTSFMQFSLNTGRGTTSTSFYNNGQINMINSTKFLGIILESTLSWRQHIDYINVKLYSLGYIIRSLRGILSLEIVKQIYCSYVHSVLNYGIIFWGSSSYCKTLFITQKRIIRIIMKANVRESCRDMFRELGILTLYSQYIYSILMFVANHKEIFKTNNDLNGLNTRQKLNLHVPSVRLTKVQKGVYYSGIIIYNKLPNGIKEKIGKLREFKTVLKRFLMENPFYSIAEYMDCDVCKDNKDFNEYTKRQSYEYS